METTVPVHSESTGFLSTIFNQEFAELIHDAIAVGIVEVWKLIILAIFLYIVHEIVHRWRLSNRSDNKHVSFSINYFEVDVNNVRMLRLRPLNKEVSVQELFPNIILQRAFTKAAAATTLDNPMMHFPLKLESAIMNTLQSYISDDFTEGFMRKAVGLPVITRKFVFMAVHERYEDVTVRKIRVIVTQAELLNHVPTRKEVAFEKPHQSMRLATMDHIAAHYRNLTDERQKRHNLEILLSCNQVDMTEDLATKTA